MHVVIFKTLNPHRLERASPYVQGHECGLNTFGGDGLHQRLIEMQPGRRRCNSAKTLSVDRLITLTV